MRMIRLHGIVPIVLTFICCLRCPNFRGMIFFRPYRGEPLPEVCSHGLEHVMLCYEDYGSYSYLSPLITIQEGRYRYCVSPNGNIVKFAIAEFLAVEVNIEM